MVTDRNDEFTGGKIMRLTRHNGRSGKNGVYNPKHNDRRFDVEKSEHIDPDRTKENVYWDCYQGFHYAANSEKADQIIHSFEEIESLYYWEHYEDFCKAQNERNRKTGHTERNRSPDDIRLDKRTCPEESVLQIGTREEHVSGEMLRCITADFFEEFEKRFGKHVHILNWSLHMDEATPHIQERHVFDCPNRYGEICPQQEKALEALGIEMPDPDKKKGKMNYRKVTFDAICRTMLFDIAKRYDLHLEEEPEYGGRKYLEKQDYILMKQSDLITERKAAIDAEEEKLADRQDAVEKKEKELAALETKIQDTESFIAEITETAYNDAVDMLSEKAAEEARNLFFEEVSGFREDMLVNGDHSIAVREYIYQALEPLLDRFRGLTKHITDQIRHLFSEPVKKEKFRQLLIENRRSFLFGDKPGRSLSEQVENRPDRRRRSR